jgi:UDPglucose 6-dehydrogenase
MIGIIGYGMVGKALAKGFPKCQHIISDPKYNSVTVADVCNHNPEAIFVCVPTMTDDSNYAVLKTVLSEIKKFNYAGITVVKSTILSTHLENFDVVFNPEFLSRATAIDDFINPVMLVFGGDTARTNKLHDIYKKYSIVETDHVFHTDIKTATLLKYSFNTFYAMKITYMNTLYDIANDLGANYSELASMMKINPWMGTHHFDVPGPDGKRGFGGPCLPKDTAALAREFDLELLHSILEFNKKYRNEDPLSCSE